MASLVGKEHEEPMKDVLQQQSHWRLAQQQQAQERLSAAKHWSLEQRQDLGSNLIDEQMKEDFDAAAVGVLLRLVLRMQQNRG
jgi:hypothetical protein